MTDDEIAWLIDNMAAAYAGVRVDGDLAVAWASHLATVDFDVACAAGHRWAQTQARFPSIAELLATIRDELALRRLDEREDLPAEQPVSHPLWRGFLDALRDQLRVDRDGRDGPAAFAEATAALRAGPGPPERSYRCSCMDLGFVADDPDETAWRPCPQCSPESAQRWRDGHYRPGHTCSECAPRGRRAAV